jgi:hypothetical protein
VTARGAPDQRKPRFELGLTRSSSVERSTDQAETARVRIDDAYADRRAGSEPELRGRKLRQAADPLAHRTHALANPSVTGLRQLRQTDLREEVVRPALLVAEIRPLANDSAKRARVVSRCAIAQKIGQIQEAASTPERLWKPLCEPR